MDEAAWRGGLAPHYDYMLTEKPKNPEMRESASIWVFEENGAFAFPRNGIEGIGSAWDNHRYDCNFTFPDGRTLFETRTDGKTRSPIGPDGKPSILGSGGLAFQCVEPYHRWRVTYEGEPIDTTSADIIAGTVDRSKTAKVSYEIDLTMVTPCWVQDNTPEALERMSERERIDAGLMGFGYRMEHHFRGEGKLTIDGETRQFKCVGNRVHRQSVRPLGAFRGHCWQAAVFPDGRAFGYIAYPPSEDGSTYDEGYVWQDGKWYPAVARNIPFLRNLAANGDDISVEMEYELGVAKIKGVSRLGNFKLGGKDMPGFSLNQGGGEYTWDDQTAYGMIERSSWDSEIKHD